MYTCPLCGKPVDEDDHLDVGHTYRVLMLEDGRCIDCAYWPRTLHTVLLRERHRHPIVGGVHYIIAPDWSSGDTRRGHGGRRFVLRELSTGRLVETRNLWNNGRLPPDLRLAMQDTHEFVEMEPPTW